VKKSKILIVVAHGLYEPWVNILHEGQRKTWLRWPLPEEVKVIHLHGTPLSPIGWKLDRLHEKIRWTNKWVARPLAWLDRFLLLPFRWYIPKISRSELLEIEQKVLHVHFPDSYLNFHWKFLALLKYFLEETDFDFIFSTTTSSMIKPFALQRLVSEFSPEKIIYAGVKPYDGANFAAGNNRLLSRSTVKLIIKSRWRIDPGTIEDKAIGDLLFKLGVQFIELPSLNITDKEGLKSPKLIEDLISNFHIRVKSGTFEERGDVLLMHAIEQRLNEIGGEL
jgi:glycosyltransferase involved in cell wall biosynthesis